MILKKVKFLLIAIIISLMGFQFSFADKPFTLNITNFQEYRYTSTNISIEKNKIFLLKQRSFTENALLYSFENRGDASLKAGILLFSEDGYKGNALEMVSKENYVSIKNPPHPFFGQTSDMGHFTIECFFYLYDLKGISTLMKKNTIILESNSGNIITQGFSIYIENRNLIFEFNNFFHFKNKRKSVVLSKSPYLITGRWYHLTISFNALTGSLIKYLDKKIIEVNYLTEDGTPNSTIYYAAFMPQNTAPFIIGSDNMTGKVDELSFYNEYLQPKDALETEDFDAEFTSDVFFLQQESKLNLIEFKRPQLPAISQLFYRTSNQYFLANNRNIAWKELPINQNLNNLSTYHKYAQFQIKIQMPQTQHPYFIDKLALHYSKNIKPLPPIIVSTKVIPSGIKINWIRSTDSNIKGYNIYYKVGGFRDFQSAKMKRTVNVAPLNPSENNPNQIITYIIDNLENNQLYSLALTAFDDDGKENESHYSKIIQFTPSAFIEN